MRRSVTGLILVALICGLGSVLAAATTAQDKATPPSLQPATYEAQTDLASLEGVVTADGSSTVYPITDEAGLRFMELADDVRVAVSFSGTGEGFRKFCEGETDIQDASRPIEADEIASCASNGIDYYIFEIAYDGISVVVNPENDFVDCLTTEQLDRLWRPDDNADTWADLDPAWPDREIDLYGPGPASGTFDYFTRVIVGTERSSRTDYFPSENDGDLVLGVAEDKDGLAYFGFGNYQVNRDELKLVAIDSGSGCVEPSQETIADGSYAPLSRPLFIYVAAKELGRPEFQEFLRFYLAHASQVAIDVGYVPAPDRAYTDDLVKLEAAIADELPPDGPR